MTRLFIRFYIGVIAILVAAWLIQSYVFEGRSQSQNVRVVEQALSGGARLARDELAASSPGQVAATFKRIQDRFEYPVQRIEFSEDWLTPQLKERLRAGEAVFLGEHIAIAVNEPEKLKSPMPPFEDQPTQSLMENADGEILLFGPLPRFVGPSQTAVTFGYGVVFLLAAVAIAILLRPVVFQMRAVERAATAIAQGDLSARVDSTKAPKYLALIRAFNSMADRTEALLRSQRELLQAVSHELRTPLARIRFAVDLVETAKSDDERRARLEAIDDATEKLDHLVGELLTYVRLDSNVPQDQSEPIDVNHLFTELIELYAPLSPTIRFEQQPSSKPIELSSSQVGLSRAVENLLSNAAKHAKSHVLLQARRTNREVIVEVDDDGEGVPPKDQHKIFEPFVRLDNSQEPGTGLGLALVHRIAKRHGGSVQVGESPLGGARFTLRLPN